MRTSGASWSSRRPLTEFARSGFSGTSTEAIAKRAGISQPYVFRLFATKKDLFIAVVNSCFDRVYNAFLAAADGKFGDGRQGRHGRAYTVLLQDRELLTTQMHAYAAAATTPRSGRRPATASAGSGCWCERATGLPEEEVVQFFAIGMLINVAASLDLPHLKEPWAQGLIALTCPDMIARLAPPPHPHGSLPAQLS